MELKKRKIAIVTGTRAEFGLLKSLIKKLNNDNHINLSLLVTGSHLSAKHGKTINEIIDNGFEVSSKIDLNLGSDTAKDISEATAKGIKRVFKIFLDSKTRSFNCFGR